MNLKTIGIASALLLSQVGFAAPSKVICRVDESLSGRKQPTYEVKASISDNDSTAQISEDAKLVKGVHFNVFGCPSCAKQDKLSKPSLWIEFMDKTQKSETASFSSADDRLISYHSVGFMTVSLNCALN